MSSRAGAHCAGLCEAPRIEQILVAPSGEDLVVRTNFGLLARRSGSWTRFCYEQLGGSVYSMLGAPGDVAIATASGVSTAGVDICEWKPGGAGLVSSWVVDLSASREKRSEALALVSDPLGNALFLQRSSDGAATFAPGHRLPDDAAYMQALSAGAGERALAYLAGPRFSPRGFSILHSSQAGEWTSVAHGMPDSAPDFRLLGTPGDEPAILFALEKSSGEEPESVWRSSDFGRGMTRVLRFDADEALAGFAFGESASEIFVASQSAQSSTLYRSSNGGLSFERARAGLPRLSCLVYAQRRLVACAAELAPDAPFFVARSEDLGATWSALMRPADLTSAAVCSKEACADTRHVLCEEYELCAPGADAPSGAAAESAGSSSCAVRPLVGARPLSTGSAGIALAVALAHSFRRRRP